MVRGQRGSDYGGGTAGAADGGRERENARVPRGDGGGGGRGVSTYHTPSIPKSRGRLATRQIVVAGKAHFSAVAARTAGGGEEAK